MSVLEKIDSNIEVYEKSKEFGLTDIQARVLSNRLNDKDKITDIIYPVKDNIMDYNLLKDIDRSSKVIYNSIKNNEFIISVTDSDCDGITSAVVMDIIIRRYFKYKNYKTIINRRDYGNGINDTLVKKINDINLNKPIGLMITADHGSSDITRLLKIKEMGIKVVITDHHLVPDDMDSSKIDGFVNPQQDGCKYDKSICGAVVIFLVLSKVRELFIKDNIEIEEFDKLYSYLSIATIADSMSLSSITNRAIVALGLREINRFEDMLWVILKSRLNLDYLITEKDIGFSIAPLINATNRIGNPEDGYKFLLGGDKTTIINRLDKLIKLNDNRKNRQSLMFKDALDQSKIRLKQYKNVLCVFLTEYNGIQGIIASMLLEKYNRPTVVFIEDKDKYKGSGRSNSVNLREMFEKVDLKDNTIIKKFGGHKGAAGIEIYKNKVNDFINLFNKEVGLEFAINKPITLYRYDMSIPYNLLNIKIIKELSIFAPYGMDWDKPKFKNIFTIKNIRPIGNDRTHLLIEFFKPDNSSIKAIYMGGNNSDIKFKKDDRVEVLYTPEINVYNNIVNLQLFVLYMNII